MGHIQLTRRFNLALKLLLGEQGLGLALLPRSSRGVGYAPRARAMTPGNSGMSPLRLLRLGAARGLCTPLSPQAPPLQLPLAILYLFWRSRKLQPLGL